MNKKILALCAFMLLAVVLTAQTVQPKKQKIKVDEAEKVMYEFFSNYKRDNAFSSVEVEDLKGVTIGKTTTTMEKRVVFRHVNKR